MSKSRTSSVPPQDLADSAARARERALSEGVAAPRPPAEAPERVEGRACPSSRADRPESLAFAVAEGPLLAYLQEPVAAAEVLGLAAPASPTQVFRFTSPCEGGACPNYGNGHCQLGRRVMEGLPEVVDGLPACRIRASCRWFAEQGAGICRRCPQIVTEQVNPSAAFRAVALGPRRFLPLLVQTWLLVMAVLVTGCAREVPPRDLRAECGKNQQKLAWALGAYAQDNAGLYPVSAAGLSPRYLPDLPRCPTNGAEYYVATGSKPPRFTIVCQGVHP